jgi:hypothetical protein
MDPKHTAARDGDLVAVRSFGDVRYLDFKLEGGRLIVRIG